MRKSRYAIPPFKVVFVRAGFKLTICAGLKLTRRYSSVTYYTAVDKSTRLQLVLNSCSG